MPHAFAAGALFTPRHFSIYSRIGRGARTFLRKEGQKLSSKTFLPKFCLAKIPITKKNNMTTNPPPLPCVAAYRSNSFVGCLLFDRLVYIVILFYISVFYFIYDSHLGYVFLYNTLVFIFVARV